MNAGTERSLSVNARIVTKERTRLGERTIVGFRAVKDAVKFQDPVHLRPEKIPVSDALKRAVRSAHSKYQQRLEQEQAEEKNRKAEQVKQVEEEERRKQEQEMLSKENALYF